ncbi:MULTISPECIES: DUF982 domain-containing protein [unclassified Mesorhizobium]|uniref:DUF982 domain-containing protein n=1 Tax=unclassified Mesorhizobium TaxID=325217 RepID=UPI0003CDEDA5|nr:DUF982 domain-containing protein [Mesorhizobium sp. LSHC420B00]ESX82905.1 hypothetical protein X759_00805 [Mesorhizobium sp. LSHC420B00]
MTKKSFGRPVPILVGLGFPRHVENVWQAYDVLNEWPSRGPAHKAAFDACRAGLADEVDTQTVRAAFEAFARKAGILAHDMTTETPARITTPAKAHDVWLKRPSDGPPDPGETQLT